MIIQKNNSIKYCKVCSIELNNNTWYISSQKKHDYTCIPCQLSKKRLQRRFDNIPIRKVGTVIDADKIYHQKNKEHYKKIRKLYRQTNGKEIIKKLRSKHRSLGFIPMNEPFENSEGHHLDNEFVIYIPKELHRSVWHNQTTGKNMELINLKAFEWMISIIKIQTHGHRFTTKSNN